MHKVNSTMLHIEEYKIKQQNAEMQRIISIRWILIEITKCYQKYITNWGQSLIIQATSSSVTAQMKLIINPTVGKIGLQL